MITETIIDVLCKLGVAVINLLPVVSVMIPGSVLNTIKTLVGALGYIVPVKQLMPIIAISTALATWNVSWSLMLRLKSFLPNWGN